VLVVRPPPLPLPLAPMSLLQPPLPLLLAPMSLLQSMLLLPLAQMCQMSLPAPQ
jgi:hypothetical protein